MSPDASNEELAPPESTADGTQQVETSSNSIIEVLTPVDSKLGSSPFQTAFEYLSQTHPRGLGGEIVSVLVTATTRYLTFELNEKKTELGEARREVESMRNQLSQKDIAIAVQEERITNLKERITSFSQGRHFHYLLLTFGTALMGFAIEFFRNNMIAYGLSFAFIGLIIVLGTWFFTPKGGEK